MRVYIRPAVVNKKASPFCARGRFLRVSWVGGSGSFVIVEQATAVEPHDRVLHLDFIGVIYSFQRLWEHRGIGL